ncbi:MAG: tRNA (adenosine(37)-N6)-threonylcarbamoyltransferase complex transferase subunit TsaD, partial [Armatimonadaceae bacterium]
MIVLGIETSCDETACAIVQDGRKLLCTVVASQMEEHANYGGVVPELASRRHVELLIPVVRQALTEANLTLKDITAIGVTNRPGL